jgi:C1A family cysteine protease
MNYFSKLNPFSFFSSQNVSAKYKYGWKKGDKYKISNKKMYKVYSHLKNVNMVDLRNNCPSVYNQGQLGSCSANAIGFCIHYDELKQTENNPFIPSRLFIYYNERVIEGNPSDDSGAEIHDGISTITDKGVCPEDMWKYDITQFAIKPPDNCYTEALNHKAIEYHAIEQNLNQLKSVLLEGFPIVFGFVVYPSFESPEVASTGIVPMPLSSEQPIGGHAVALVGFIEDKKQFIVRNSWGDSWGDKGYFYMPYDYVLSPDLAEDFWVVKKITVPMSISTTLKTTSSNSTSPNMSPLDLKLLENTIKRLENTETNLKKKKNKH